MRILEVAQPLHVITPKGRGRVWLVTDYGCEIEKIFTVILDETGQIWEFTNKDVQATSNVTMGRKSTDFGNSCLQHLTDPVHPRKKHETK
jgi:hypothetical protein